MEAEKFEVPEPVCRISLKPDLTLEAQFPEGAEISGEAKRIIEQMQKEIRNGFSFSGNHGRVFSVTTENKGDPITLLDLSFSLSCRMHKLVLPNIPEDELRELFILSRLRGRKS